mgnify:CR=1 FL=1
MSGGVLVPLVLRGDASRRGREHGAALARSIRVYTDERVALAQGGFVRVAASQRPPGLDIDGVASGLLLTAQERPEDLRIDAGGRYLFARLLTPARTRAEEITWLCKYDLKHRRLARRTSVNPVLLPAPFRP